MKAVHEAFESIVTCFEPLLAQHNLKPSLLDQKLMNKELGKSNMDIALQTRSIPPRARLAPPIQVAGLGRPVSAEDRPKSRGKSQVRTRSLLSLHVLWTFSLLQKVRDFQRQKPRCLTRKHDCATLRDPQEPISRPFPPFLVKAQTMTNLK